MGPKKKKKPSAQETLAPPQVSAIPASEQAPAAVSAAPPAAASAVPPHTPSAVGTTRRGFLARAGLFLTGACAVSGVAMGVRLAIPDVAGGLPSRFPLGRLVDFKINTVTWIRERDVFVVRSERGLGVLSGRCTHLGCTVRRTAEGFVCPCHGAKYDAAGQVLAGPARRALPWYETWLEPGGRLWVDLARPATTEGPQPFAIPEEDA